VNEEKWNIEVVYFSYAQYTNFAFRNRTLCLGLTCIMPRSWSIHCLSAKVFFNTVKYGDQSAA